MRIALAFIVFVLNALAGGATLAEAQAFPPGSYQRSCNQIHWDGATLVAECRRHDGRMSGTGLANALHCVGDIANIDGQLQCTHGGPPPPAAPAPPPVVAPPPPSYGQPPGPGYPPPAYGGYDEHRARCEELRHHEEELRDRLQSTPWGPDHEQLEGRLHELHDDRERQGCER